MSNPTRKRRPLQPVSGKCKWVQRPGNTTTGLLEINGTLYGLVLHTTAYELVKPVKPEGAASYHLPLDLSGCDCPDATFAGERPGGCKHRKALAALLRSIGM